MPTEEEFQARIEALSAALLQYQKDLCEGWCDVGPGYFNDCFGCKARKALNDDRDRK